MFTHRCLQAAALTAILATSGAAQTSNSLSELARRSSLSIAFDQTRPQAALGRNIGFGYGISGASLYRLDSAGVLSLRADLAGVQYGNEWKHVPFSETQLDVGMRYVNGGRARYLAPGSIVDLPSGEMSISSLESATRLVMLHIGARIGL